LYSSTTDGLLATKIFPNNPTKGCSFIFITYSAACRSELCLKQAIEKDDWNPGKEAAKPKTPALKQLNSYLEEVRATLVT